MISGLRAAADAAGDVVARGRDRLGQGAAKAAGPPLRLLAGAAGTAAGAGAFLRHHVAGRDLPPEPGEADSAADDRTDPAATDAAPTDAAPTDAERPTVEPPAERPAEVSDLVDRGDDSAADPAVDPEPRPAAELVVEEPKEHVELRVE